MSVLCIFIHSCSCAHLLSWKQSQNYVCMSLCVQSICVRVRMGQGYALIQYLSNLHACRPSERLAGRETRGHQVCTTKNRVQSMALPGSTVSQSARKDSLSSLRCLRTNQNAAFVEWESLGLYAWYKRQETSAQNVWNCQVSKLRNIKVLLVFE